MVTTIQIDESLKKRLDKIKVHHRETYNELLVRLVDSIVKENNDPESLSETIEIISDPGAMRDIAEALEEYEKGMFVEL